MGPIQTLSKLIYGLLPVLYFTLLVSYWLYLFRRDEAAGRLTGPLLWLTLALHLLGTGVRGWAQGRLPVATAPEVFSALALFLALVYRIIESRLKVRAVGCFALLLVVLFQFGASTFIEDQPQLTAKVASPWFAFHVSFALAAYASFILATVFGLLYILLYGDLKRHRFGRLYQQLPSLEALNSMNLGAALIGLLTMTVAISAGMVQERLLVPQNDQAPLLLIACAAAAWFVYGIAIIARWVFRSGGYSLALFSIAAFPFTFFSLVLTLRLHKGFNKFS